MFVLGLIVNNFCLLTGLSRLVLSRLSLYRELSSRRSQIPLGNVLLLRRCLKCLWNLFNSNKEEVHTTSKLLEMPLGSIHIKIKIILEILPSNNKWGVYSTKKGVCTTMEMLAVGLVLLSRSLTLP